MSVPLSPASEPLPRGLASAQSSARRSKARDCSIKGVERATRVSHTNLWSFKSGRNLPRLDTALRLAAALRWPRLADIVRQARTQKCERPRCPVIFLNEGGNRKRYCSADCLTLATLMRDPTDFEPGGRALLAALRSELERARGSSGALRRRALQAAADEYARSGSKRGMRLESLERMLGTAVGAVQGFCNACEPDGYCKTPTCELRPVSPLPVLGEERDIAVAEKAPGRYGGENRDVQIAAFREQLHRRWADPAERERARALMRQRHAAMTPEQRRAWIASISATKQARAAVERRRQSAARVRASPHRTAVTYPDAAT